MTKDRKRSLDEIVNVAQTLAPGEQLRYIKEACADDDQLSSDALKQMQSRQHWFDRESSDDTQSEDVQGATEAGEIIGSYRIIRSLGQGGMGEVFLAERADQQFEQQVAIKLVRRGLLSRHVQGRLRQERQILATLDHPNIARLYDGGTTKEGTPYIVMEYIDGQPIDVYCDQKRLNIPDRLRLFVKVCSAVHRAHQSLIVHRDLKPSNILVNSTGVPKLLDFGIAKLLDERQSMHTMAVTQADVRVMTPDHASPEQIQGDVITTSSDIYVLGILLYELLAGYKPFALEGNRLAELERAICEDTPPSLSAAIAGAESTAPATVGQIAAERSVTVAKLKRELGGDLNNIVMMAIRKEPERRYASVEQLSADVQRYLDGMPISARPDLWSYRANKFVRRHAIPVSLAGAFVVLLIGFSTTTYLQAQQIRRERDAAEAERMRAEDVSTFLVDSFRLADPAQSRGKEITAREILDSGANRISKELQSQPALQARLLDTIGGVYLGLGQYKDAEPLIAHGLDLRRTIAPDGSREVAQSLYSLNRVYEQKGDLAKAEQLARENLELNRRHLGERSVDTAQSICRLGVIVRKQSNFSEATRLFTQCLDLLTELRGKESVLRTVPLDNLARIAQEQREYVTAKKLIEESLAIDRATRGEDHPQYIQHLMHLASVKANLGEIDSADATFKEVLALCERVLGKDHPETINAMSARALFLTDVNRLDEAEELFGTVLAANRKIYSSDHYLVANDLDRLGRLEFKKKKFAASEAHYKEALAIYRKVLPDGNGLTAAALNYLGRARLEQNHPKDAEATLREAMDAWRIQYGDKSRGFAIARAAFGRSLAMQKRYAEAEPALIESYPIIRQTRGSSGTESEIMVEEWIKEMYRETGRPAAAQEYFAQLSAPK